MTFAEGGETPLFTTEDTEVAESNLLRVLRVLRGSLEG